MHLTILHHLLFIFVLITASHATNQTNDNCEEKEKPAALFDIAKNVLEKVKLLIPNCDRENNVPHLNKSECGQKVKTAAFIDGILGLIDDAKETFPECGYHNITKPDENPNEKPEEEPTEKPEEKPTEKPEEKPKDAPTGIDCLEIRQKGFNTSGVYTIQLNIPDGQNKSLDVYCDMDTDGGGWTIIQRRDNFTFQENFYRDWKTYKTGFGNITRDFWIGNDVIHFLSNQGKTAIRFDVKDIKKEKRFALYQDFKIENEKDLYKIHIDNYSGNAGNSMEYHNGMNFTTYDRKHNPSKDNCAEVRKGGWWYKSCYRCNPNGLYTPGVNKTESANWIDWRSVEGLEFFEIKVRKLMSTTSKL